MRTVLALVPLALFAAPVAGQSGPYLAEVTADRVAVRSGPSDQLPDTGVLFRGRRVLVDHEDGGWVAIAPPGGQVSWIRGVHLEPMDGQVDLPRNAIVNAEPEAEIALGRPGLGKPLDVRRAKVPDRTIVLVIGQPVKVDGVNWFPIEPPDGDFRYVPKTAVRFVVGKPSQGFVVHSPQPEAAPAPKAGFQPVTASIPNSSGKPAGWPNHPLWQQAESAERNLDYAKAESLYLKLAAEMNQAGGDAELANLCYTRVHAVREKQRQGNRPVTDTARRTNESPVGQWIGPGNLRLAGLKWEQRVTYALVGPQGSLKCYAIAGPGVDLERFKGADVDLFGTLETPGDLRGIGVLTVTRVQMARER